MSHKSELIEASDLLQRASDIVRNTAWRVTSNEVASYKMLRLAKEAIEEAKIVRDNLKRKETH